MCATPRPPPRLERRACLLERLPLLCTLLVAAPACGPDPPPRWAEGGTDLPLAAARWDREDGEVIELTADGQVLDDGDLEHVVDRVGRVTTSDYEPLALLLADGRLAGLDSVYLGRVGLRNASPPWRESAWVALLPSGEVMRFDDDGTRHPDGRWQGCEGPQLRACTLVTHVVLLDRRAARRSRSGSGFSLGTGVMIMR